MNNPLIKINTMNTKHISLAFAAAAALLAGCAKSPIEEVKPSEQLADLELSYVGATETKAAIDGATFPTDGKIGLFLFKDEAATTPYGASGYTNVKYAYNSDKKKWTANPSIKVGSTPGYLYGYYPYKADTQEQPINVKAIPVESSLNGDDVMYATPVKDVTDQTATQTAITMNHALARVAIKVVNNGYTGEAKLSKIKLEGAEIAPSGTLNATDGSISAKKSSVTLDIQTANQAITAGGTTYECLLVPSKIVSDKQEVTLTLTIDGKDKTANLSGANGVIIAQNTKSNITIGLSNSGISVSSVSIDDWKEVEVGGHKVKVKFDEGVSEIEKDVWMMAYAQDGNAVIEAFSKSGKQITCQLDDDSMVNPEITDNISKFVIPVESKDIVATIGVWGEGGRKEVTVGEHKVTVELANGVNESDVWFNAYVNSDGKAAVSVQSSNGKKLSFRRNDTGTILGIAPQDNIYDIVLSEVNQDITVTIDYFLNSNPEFTTINGHNVSVVLDADTDILKGISIDNNGKLVIEAESSSDKPVKCVKDGERIAGSKTGTLYKFIISDITGDATITIGYSKYTATIGFTQGSVTDKATLKINGEEVEAGRSISVFEGTNVEYSAVADDGYLVFGWYDNNGQKISNAESFTVSEISSDVAYYAEVKAGCRLTVNTISAGTSTIAANGVSIESGRAYYYDPDAQITLTASPATGCQFVEWCDADGKTLSTENPYSFTLSSSLTITAVFVPQDALSGVFSVSGNKKVRFSKGNLWYGKVGDASEATFNFEANQYDVPPLTSDNETESHIGHFYWSKYATVANSLLNYTDSGASATDVFFTNDSENQAKPHIEFTVNGQTGFWRVLSGGTNGEWKYLINYNDECGTTVRSGKYKYGVTVCGKTNCLVLLPDDWKWGENGVGDKWQDGGYPETSTDKVTWQTMETAGAVCLPAAGYRDGGPGSPHPARVVIVGDFGYYWSASPSNGSSAYDLRFNSGDVNPNNFDARRRAQSVRLVTESK